MEPNRVLDLEDVSENVKFLFFTPYNLFITGVDYSKVIFVDTMQIIKTDETPDPH